MNFTPTRAQIEGFSAARLVVTDMDGTLLDDQHMIPSSFGSILNELAQRGIAFAPASGRQYATLRAQFLEFSSTTRSAPVTHYIAENGSVVVYDDSVISTITMDPHLVASLIDVLDNLGAHGHNVGIVLCTPQAAYVDKTYGDILEETRRYYHSLSVVDSLKIPEKDLPSDVIKLALYSYAPAEERVYPELHKIFGTTINLALSGTHWVDIMAPTVNKSVGITRLCEKLDCTTDHVVAFGDYLNDRELLSCARQSYAMSNAHPLVKEAAAYCAPSNEEHGVITVLSALLDATA